jgi:hypothetical protein
VSGVCCQVEVSGQADHLTRGVLLSVVCSVSVIVIVNPYKGRPGPRIGPKFHRGGGIVLSKFYKCFLLGYCKKKQKTAYMPHNVVMSYE